MEENRYNWEHFPNVGTINSRFNESQLAPIWEEINQIKTDFDSAIPVNEKLAGHILREYKLVKCKSYIEELVLPLVEAHSNNFYYLRNQQYTCITPPKLKLNLAWVNFQRKHEFNPMHVHYGIMSFVIWMKIPYNIQDEYKVFPRVLGNRTGCFEMMFTDSLGAISVQSIPVDKTFEGTILLFPSSLNHAVNPFYTSDDYRITVSGNFAYDLT